MTDSGFSSAASSRSLSSIIKPGLLNSSNSDSSANTMPSKGNMKDSTLSTSSEGFNSIPKPAAYLQASGNRPILTNRFLYNKANGGYSPGIYSPKEMSPMSSLALDFRDLNTSRDASDTPRKRLSLSSVSSLESPHLIPSPAISLGSSTLNSPHVIPDDEGCFTDTPSPLDLTEMEARFDQRALQEKDMNTYDGMRSCGDGKLSKYRRFKSMPAASTSHFRFPLASQHEQVGKENNVIVSSVKQTFSKFHGISESPSPMQSKVGASPSPFHTFSRRRHSMLMSPNMTSSPLAPNFSSSTSSAFSTVQHGSTSGNIRRTSVERIANQEELEKEAEKQLRDAKSPTNGSRTPVKSKSVVPSSISSLSARTRVMMSRPASAAPFYGGKSPSSGNLSPIPARAIKRSLDSSNTSQVASIKRHKRSLTSSIESSTTRRKMAFSSKDRKVKSAEAAFLHSSPVDDMKASFRPISAPAEMLSSDDDIPLSHSRLCSSNDADSDSDVPMVTSSLDHDRNDEERLLEEMLSETAQGRRDSSISSNACGRGKSGTPSGLDGLITAPLLLSATVLENKEDESLVERLPKPRELFRSPSAPPVISSRRSAIRRARQHTEGSTPFGTRRCQLVSDRGSFPTLAEVTSHEIDEEPSAVLNRSRSVNELDIMRAVEVGCSDPNLVGDFTRACSLKTVAGKHQDLKYIATETLIDLIEKKQDKICYEIIDCRYPYEYEGGHVVDANSVWEEEALFKRYFHNPKPMWAAKNDGAYKPPVLVFYCEFSSERGPRMARALRNQDRSLNAYPHLHYPEIYVLKDGYKNFFNTEGSAKYCQPSDYRPMAHEDFARELRMCRIKSKTWAGEKTKCGLYNRLKRL